MILVEGEKYACIQCIRGHRSSTCQHTERPLVQVRSRGRPTSIETHRVAVFAKDEKHIFVNEKPKLTVSKKAKGNIHNQEMVNQKFKQEAPDFNEPLFSMKRPSNCCSDKKSEPSNCYSSDTQVMSSSLSPSPSVSGSCNSKTSGLLNCCSSNANINNVQPKPRQSSCCSTNKVTKPKGGCCSIKNNDQACPTKSTSLGKVIVVRPSKTRLVEIKEGTMKIIKSNISSMKPKLASYTLNPVFKSNYTGNNNSNNHIAYTPSNCGGCGAGNTCNCTSIVNTEEDFKKNCGVFKINIPENNESKKLSTMSHNQAIPMNNGNDHNITSEEQIQEYLSGLSKNTLVYMNNCKCDDTCACDSCLVHNGEAINKAKTSNLIEKVTRSALDADEINRNLNIGISDIFKNIDESTPKAINNSNLNGNTNNLENNSVNVHTNLSNSMKHPVNRNSSLKFTGEGNCGNDIVFSFVNHVPINHSNNTNVNDKIDIGAMNQGTAAASINNFNTSSASKSDDVDINNSYLNNSNNAVLQYNNLILKDIEMEIPAAIDPALNYFENNNIANDPPEMYDFIVADSCTIPGSCACDDDCSCEGCVVHNNNRNNC